MDGCADFEHTMALAKHTLVATLAIQHIIINNNNNKWVFALYKYPFIIIFIIITWSLALCFSITLATNMLSVT
jgi:hypothetical protein